MLDVKKKVRVERVEQIKCWALAYLITEPIQCLKCCCQIDQVVTLTQRLSPPQRRYYFISAAKTIVCLAVRGMQSVHTSAVQLLLQGWDSAGPQWTFVNWLVGCRYHNAGIAIVCLRWWPSPSVITVPKWLFSSGDGKHFPQLEPACWNLGSSNYHFS